jgi:hypothetical protein
MPFPPRKLLSLAAALALVLAFPLARAQDVTIVVPDDGTAVLYSHDAAPDAVLALDPASAPEAVSLLLSSAASMMPEAAANEGEEVEAAVASLFAAAAADSAVEQSTTEEEAMVEATVSMLQAALGDTEPESAVSLESANAAEVAAAAAADDDDAAAAVAGEPAPEAVAAAAPSPAVAVVPTAQLVCPPTCPSGTRCRQGGRGVCEPFSAFDCAGGKCAPSPSAAAPPTPPPSTAPAVCGTKCTDVAPTPNWSCAQQRSFGACEQGWMAEGGFCQITCGRCPAECYDCRSMCLDRAPDGNGCAAQAGWGKCGETWMAGCMRSCGKCPAKCYSKAAASSDGVAAGGAEVVSLVSVSASTRLLIKAKSAPSPSPSFELGPVSAPFGALSEVAAGPQGAPEVSSSFPAVPAAASSSSPSSSAAEAEAISDGDASEVSAAIERMMASTQGTMAAESAFEA